MQRREFLKLSGCFLATASLSPLIGCGDDDDGMDPPEPGTFSFPQGVASGDPRPDSVMLWTRAVPGEGTAEVAITIEVSTTSSFTSLIVSQEARVGTASDHTLRVLVEGLQPATLYYYRFRAGEQLSEVGRTFTAPADDDTGEVHFAWASCQDYSAGTYAAWRQMIVEDEEKPEAEQIRFVLQLGDFVYETLKSGFQGALDENHQPIDLIDQGMARTIEAFPDGGMTGTSRHARTLADYRHLYKQFLRDPHLRAARARWPFIQVWDDHEFTNDAWQSQANYDDEDSLGEPSQTRRLAASQAWFEFVPANLTEAPAHDFATVTVEDAAFTTPDVDNFVPEPNNVAAIGALTIYRRLRWGKHLELVLTDQRSYRSDHPIPEEMTGNAAFFDARAAVPEEMALTFDAGSSANGGSPPAEVLGFPNPRQTTPPGTMLGAAQREWFKQAMTTSTATWKVWGNEVTLQPIRLRKGPVEVLIFDRILTSDAWDGFHHERTELMTYLADEDVRNVVILTGDIHAHIVGVVVDDHLAAEPRPVAVELASAGISSNSLFSFFEVAARGVPVEVARLVSFDGSASGGPTLVNNLNMVLLHGTQSATTVATGGTVVDAIGQRDVTQNPNLRFIDSAAQGYGLVHVSGTELNATLVTIPRPIADTASTEPAIKGTASFRIPLQTAAADVTLEGPVLTGALPYPLT